MGKLRSYSVTIPIAGHCHVTVEAENEEEAREKAWEAAADENNRELEWEFMERFNSGNVCHCPQPWETTVDDEGEVD